MNDWEWNKNFENWHKISEKDLRRFKAEDKKDKELHQILAALIIGAIIIAAFFFNEPRDEYYLYDCAPQYGPGQSMDCE